MPTNALVLFEQRRDAVIADVIAAMKTHYGERLIVNRAPTQPGSVHFGIDPKPGASAASPDDAPHRCAFDYHVGVRPWGKHNTGVLNVEYGTGRYRGSSHVRSKNDGTVDIAKIVADCESRRLAAISERDAQRQQDVVYQRAKATVEAAGLTGDSRVNVTQYGRIVVSAGMPDTVDPAALRALMAAARELSNTPEQPA